MTDVDMVAINKINRLMMMRHIVLAPMMMLLLIWMKMKMVVFMTQLMM